MEMEKRNILNYLGQKIGELELPFGTPENVWQSRLSAFASEPPKEKSEQDAFRERFRQRYLQRSQIKDALIADMATSNMERVYSGSWTISQLRELTQDAQVKMIVDDVNTLSFELAIEKINSIGNHLITKEVKDQWIELIQRHLYI